MSVSFIQHISWVRRNTHYPSHTPTPTSDHINEAILRTICINLHFSGKKCFWRHSIAQNVDCCIVCHHSPSGNPAFPPKQLLAFFKNLILHFTCNTRTTMPHVLIKCFLISDKRSNKNQKEHLMCCSSCPYNLLHLVGQDHRDSGHTQGLASHHLTSLFLSYRRSFGECTDLSVCISELKKEI